MVERSVGAEARPDTDVLKTEVEAIAGAPLLSGAGPTRVDIVVGIEAKGTEFSATVVSSGVRSGERTLDDPGPGCDVLAHGLAVSIAILLGADPESPPQDPDVPLPKPARPPPGRFLLPAIAPEPPPERRRRVPPLTGSIGPIYATGILPGDAAGAALSLDVYIPNAGFGIGVVWLPHDELELEEHHASYAYAGARTRACARQPNLKQYGLIACLRFAAGRRIATLVDESNDEPVDENDGGYVALGGKLEISRRVAGPFGVYADLGLDIGLYQDDISLHTPSLGRVDPAELGLSFDTGVGIRFWLEDEDEPPPP